MLKLQLSGIFERDVDLLLWEELVASREFLSWFLRKAGLSGRVRLAGVERSVTTETGESDLVIDVRRGTATIKVLVENKLDAVFQPLQARRYRRRAAAYVNNRECDSAFTVIVAPESYFGNREECLEFDACVTYESIIRWFERSSALGTRGQCKSFLLRRAINDSGWKRVPDKAATNFWHLYWQRAMNRAPQLQMTEPEGVPATSNFIYFRPSGLAPSVRLIHKLPYGRVDLQFARKGNRVEEIERAYGPHLDSDMRIGRANKSAVIRIIVPPIEMKGNFHSSEAAVKKGIEAATRLLVLYKHAVGERRRKPSRRLR